MFVALPAAPAAARTRRAVVRATADGYVRADRRAASFGHLGTLVVGGRPRARAYLRFRVPGAKRMAVARASPLVYVRHGPRDSLRAARTSGRAWTESGLTWRRAPALRPAVAVSRPSGKHWARIDVTALVHRGGRLDLALTSSGRGSVLASRETGSRQAPRLSLRTFRDTQPRFPIRTAFYSTAYPESWSAPGLDPATHFSPGLGLYDSRSRTLLGKHLRAIAYAGLSGGLAEWLGPRAPSDVRLTGLLKATRAIHSRLLFGAQVPAATGGAANVAEAAEVLAYLDRTRGRDSAFLRVGGRPVVFVSPGLDRPCTTARRWVRANAAVGTYLLLEAFPNYRSCAVRPRGWYGPGTRQPPAAAGDRTYTIRPGFFDAGERQPQLIRDLGRWYSDVRRMRASRARWQLVDSFNGWRAGTAVGAGGRMGGRGGVGQRRGRRRSRGGAGVATACTSMRPAPAASRPPAGRVAIPRLGPQET